MKMKIIGHRGAAGLALENTLEALRAGIDNGADILEFDVRLTKDKQVVLCHDTDLDRISNDKRAIADLTYRQLQSIKLKNGSRVPLLAEALKVAGITPVIIEIKPGHAVRQVLKVLEDFPKAKATIASFKHKEITLLKELKPGIPGYVASRTNPFEIIDIAKALGADGLDLNFWILNPLTYWRARHNKLDIMVYTVNHRFFAWFIHLFYPKVMICTNNPHYFTHKKRS